jgi:hypothetical protein
LVWQTNKKKIKIKKVHILPIPKHYNIFSFGRASLVWPKAHLAEYTHLAENFTKMD